MRSLLVALFAFFPLYSLACINTYDGDLLARDYAPNMALLHGKRVELEGILQKSGDYKVANDLAVVLILLGDYLSAIEVLEDIEKKHAGENLFRTASNLGTALELSGKNDQALAWIKEGIRRNPADHEGTEWLHVKILEANLAIAQSPDWLQTNYVANVDFGDAGSPRQPGVWPKDFLGNQKTLDDLNTALAYQLKERMKFVKRPNAVVSDLLFSRGDTQALLSVPQYFVSYELAQQYGSHKADLINKRLRHAGFVLHVRAAVCATLFSAALIYGYRRKQIAVEETRESVSRTTGEALDRGRGWRTRVTHWLANLDQAYRLPFSGLRWLLWAGVIAWGVFWLGNVCGNFDAAVAPMLFTISAIGVLLHSGLIPRRKRPAVTASWTIGKWIALDAAGLLVLTLVYFGPLKLLYPVRCAKVMSGSFDGGFMISTFFLVSLAIFVVCAVIEVKQKAAKPSQD